MRTLNVLKGTFEASPATRAALAAHGVTTGLSMATWPAELVASMRDVPGLTDIRSAGLPAIGPGGLHARMPGLAEHAVVRDPAHARRFVADRVAEGIDYLKIMLEAPGDGGLPAEVAAALVAAARVHGLRVVAHAGSPGAYTLALDVGADVITHLPLGAPVADGDVTRIVADGRVVIPMLDMMRGLAGPLGLPPGAYDVSAHGSACCTPRGCRSWPAPTPTPRPVSRTSRRSVRACTTSWRCWSTRA